MAKKPVFNSRLTETESEVFKQLIQDEEFGGLLAKFREDEQQVVIKSIESMVTTIEKNLTKELSL